MSSSIVNLRGEGDEKVIPCAICMESNSPIVILPCCHKAYSSVQFCTHCIEELISSSSNAIFSCPTCRTFIGPEQGKLVIKKNVSTCAGCHSIHHTIGSSQLCHGCIKMRNLMSQLRYECERCHGLQRIPQPMWRYQLTTSSFTTPATWICHQGCNSNTRTCWRLLTEDVELVPKAERPASWNSPANKFYEMIEALDEAKIKSKERRAGFLSCVYLTACVAGAVVVLDKGLIAASKLFLQRT